MNNKWITLVAVAVFSTTFSVNAIAQKIGHIHLDSLVSMMPESKLAKEEGQKFYKEQEAFVLKLKNEFDTQYAEYQRKVNEAQTKNIPYPDNFRQIDEKKLQDLNASLQDAQQSAQAEIQKKNEVLAKPVYEKAKKAIEQVAKENGYKYIIDTSSGIALYADNNDNAMGLVKKKLGIVGLGALEEEKKMEGPKSPSPVAPAKKQ